MEQVNNWIPPDEDWVKAMARAQMANYHPPEITPEQIGIYSGSTSDDVALNNPHNVTAAQVGLGYFKSGDVIDVEARVVEEPKQLPTPKGEQDE